MVKLNGRAKRAKREDESSGQLLVLIIILINWI